MEVCSTLLLVDWENIETLEYAFAQKYSGQDGEVCEHQGLNKNIKLRVLTTNFVLESKAHESCYPS